MLPKLADSLAGRMEVLTLWSLSGAEIYNRSSQLINEILSGSFINYKASSTDPTDYVPHILAGGYPDAIRRATNSRRNNWFKGYLQTLLMRDVQDISGIERLADLPILLNILAARAGNLLNASELSRSSGVPQTTLKRYLKLFEMLYLTVYLRPWHANIGKRFVKSPKLYLSDVGLLSYLLGTGQETIFNRPEVWGHMFENYVVMELMKHQTWSEIPFQMYHYRTEGGEEIDLILETDQGDLIVIEVKGSKVVDERSIRAIKNLQMMLPNRSVRGIVIYTGTTIIPLSKNIWAMPLDYLVRGIH